MISDWIGSWNVSDLVEWRKQIDSFFNHKVEWHTMICWKNSKEKFVYKNLNMLHPVTIPDLTSKFPDCFYFIVLSKSMLEWGKTRDINKVFPINSLENNIEIPNMFIENNDQKLTIEIDTHHFTNKETFSSIDLGREDMFTAKAQKILCDFENKKFISSIIDGEKIYNHHLLMGQ